MGLLTVLLMALSFSNFVYGGNSDPRDEPANKEWLLGVSQQLSKKFGHLYQQNFARLKQGAPNCSDPERVIDYAESVYVTTDYESCLTILNSCFSQSYDDLEYLPRMHTMAAQCFQAKNDQKNAYDQYAISVQLTPLDSPNLHARIYEFASFAQFNGYENETKRILAKISNWFGVDLEVVYKSIDYFSHGNFIDSKQDIERFVKGVEQSGNLEFQKTIAASQLDFVISVERNYRLFLEKLVEKLDELNLSNSQASRVLASITYLSSSTDLTPARLFHKVLQPYFNESLLPISELNVFNYSEIYDRECKDQLLQSAAKKQFFTLSNSWAFGTLSNEQYMGDLRRLEAKFGEKADLLTAIATVQMYQENYVAAKKNYWQAFRMCPYYNRSLRGIENVLTHERYVSYSDTAELESKFLAEVSNLKFPPELEKYVVNWKFLSEQAKNHLKFSLKIWKNLIDDVYNAKKNCFQGKCRSVKNRLFVKPSLLLMSQVPTKEDYRDIRTNYDNRLRDDIRGNGNDMLVTEYDETIVGFLGAYNLSGHEFTHQLHRSFPQPLQDCVEKLYDRAMARDVFVDGYAKRNDGEYFAQGVTHIMIAEDSPPRFGPNVGWYKTNDPDLYQFITNVSQAKSISDIQCSISF